jgi:predicted phosphodiesterase
MRVAVLADIHGNLPALRAVLSDVDEQSIERIVVAGDVAGGPFVRSALDLLAAREEPVTWIRGNSEREAVAAWDGEPVSDDEVGRAAAWSAAQLDRQWRDAFDSWPLSTVLDGVRYCHGSPRRDDETLTRLTPDTALAEALAGVTENLVVGAHTHQQVIRHLTAGPTYVNCGSVGMPYEGRPGAFWLIVDDGRAELQESQYDLVAAASELRSSGFADTDSQLQESLLAPADPEWVAAFFEHAAGRGPDPGQPDSQS